MRIQTMRRPAAETARRNLKQRSTRHTVIVKASDRDAFLDALERHASKGKLEPSSGSSAMNDHSVVVDHLNYADSSFRKHKYVRD